MRSEEEIRQYRDNLLVTARRGATKPQNANAVVAAAIVVLHLDWVLGAEMPEMDEAMGHAEEGARNA